MNKTIFLALLLGCALTRPLFVQAGLEDDIDRDIEILTQSPWDRIELQDGTVIKGLITDSYDGLDTIETSDGEVFEIEDNEIYSVDVWNAKPKKPLLTEEELNDPKMKAFLEHYQWALAMDPTLMTQFSFATVNDPELAGLFGDSAFVKALANYYDHHDLAEFKKYPNAAKVMANARVMDVIEAITKKKEQPAKPIMTAEELHDPKMQAFMHNYGARIEQDAMLLKKIRAALDTDPELKDLFNDPVFLKVLASYYDHHDLGVIRKYPKAKRILANRALMELIELITTKASSKPISQS